MNNKVRIGLGVVGGGLALLALAGMGGFFYVNSAFSAKVSATYDVHEVDFPVPFPLSDEELTELRQERLAALATEGRADVVEAEEDPLAGVDLDALATERAIARGEYLLSAVYHCAECHGSDFGGGTMVDDPMLGSLLGPNLTTGKGSRVADYTLADWDRVVRHGVLPDGRATPMPAVDFLAMSDRELSDIITYIQSLPPVDREMAPVSFGPIGKVLIATGGMPFTADFVDHHAAHPELPPTADQGLAYGKHLAQPCTGCHRADFTGGPITGGAPDWPPATNLTTALADWSFEDFTKAMRDGVRPDGGQVGMPMAMTQPFNKRLKDEDMQAMFEFLQSLEPREGAH